MWIVVLVFLAIVAIIIAATIFLLVLIGDIQRHQNTNTPPVEEYPFLCELCYPDHKELARIAPGISVVVDQYKMYYICYGQYGHRDSLYMIQTKPWPDPIDHLSDDELDELAQDDPIWAQSDLWIHKADIDVKTFFYWLGSIEACNYLVEDLTEGGYNSKNDGYIWYYIFRRAGVIIRDYEAALAAEG